MLTNISMADFYEKYQNEHLDLIDVREVHEFQAGHAPGAKNLPLSTLEQGYKELKSDQEYYIICQGGGRSATACQFLRAQGLAVTNVEGGMNHWPGDVE
ncbi:rhodanese-like domain-containing protein [Streptococcus sp. SM5]|uniref:rhodanese-like domain-containing protein n=1 Tax=Streptococcus sp. SM5 TaxID=2898232 RepID=UPI0022B7B715|nr:rhodanese-like domain-containing protein [Streptococcus sp. SM5]